MDLKTILKWSPLIILLAILSVFTFDIGGFREPLKYAITDTQVWFMTISSVLVANPTFQTVAPYLVFVSMALWFLVGAFLMKNWVDFKQAVTRKTVRDISPYAQPQPSSGPGYTPQTPTPPPPEKEITA